MTHPSSLPSSQPTNSPTEKSKPPTSTPSSSPSKHPPKGGGGGGGGSGASSNSSGDVVSSPGFLAGISIGVVAIVIVAILLSFPAVRKRIPCSNPFAKKQADVAFDNWQKYQENKAREEKRNSMLDTQNPLQDDIPFPYDRSSTIVGVNANRPVSTRLQILSTSHTKAATVTNPLASSSNASTDDGIRVDNEHAENDLAFEL